MASVTWHEFAEAELDAVLSGRVKDWLSTPAPDEGPLSFSGTGASTGFDMSQLDGILGTPWNLDHHDIGEAVAAAYLERHASCFFPVLSFWDYRDPNVSPGGTDIVGYRGDGDSCRFAFAEAKTSEDKKSPPSVVSSGKHCLIKQMEHLLSVKKKRDTLVRFLQGKLSASTIGRFTAAVKAYMNESLDIHVIGVLLRPGVVQPSDLAGAATSLAGLGTTPAKVELHGVVLKSGFSALERFATALQGVTTP